MSLGIAFNNARFGLGNAEKKIAVVANNISNADRAGYTRKVLQNSYVFSGIGSVPIGGTAVHAVVDPLLVKQVIGQAATASNRSVVADYLTRYGNAFGGIGGGANSLSTNLDNLLGALKQLEGTPTDISSKTQVVSMAYSLTASLNLLSQTVQAERLRAENDIAATVTSINLSLQKIAELNRQIGAAEGAGAGAADLEDERNTALLTLSQQMGIQYFIDPNNQAQVFSKTGGSLVISTYAKQISFTPTGNVNSTVLYPTGFNPISLDGVDITSAGLGGKLGAFIQIRDATLPDEQEKLDAFANKLQLTVNRVLNQGTTYPALNTVTSTTLVTTGTSLAAATGTFRVAVTDQSGVVQQFADINLATLVPATVAGLVTALNAIGGVSASVNAAGYLEIDATSATQGISLNPMTSSFGGESITQFFGFNNLFINSGTGASTIQTNPTLIISSAGLATGALSSSGTLAVGDVGLTNADITITTSLIDALTTPQSFGAAGNFGALTTTFVNYSGSIIADVAVHANSAQSDADTATASFTYIRESMENLMGVNIDEETASLTVLQTSYQANAQLMATVKQLFETLINSVS
jgi:flagellar hook-associated protein 1 FlgK